MKKINIIGYGAMAKQIISLFFLMGYEINIWNRSEIDINLLDGEIAKLLKSDPKLSDKIKGEVLIKQNIEDFENNLTIESVAENLIVKKEIYEKLKDKITNGYFSNTSSYSPMEINEKVGGIHFFNPTRYIKLVEVFSNGYNLTTFIQDLQDMNFSVINVKKNRGYIANYVIFNEVSTAFKLMEKFGYKLNDIQEMYNKLYNGRDIFNIIDLVGVDVTYKILENLNEADSTIYLSNILNSALKNDIKGKKNNTSIKEFILNEEKGK